MEAVHKPVESTSTHLDSGQIFGVKGHRFIVETCYHCGIKFMLDKPQYDALSQGCRKVRLAMSKKHKKKYRFASHFVYCPAGHRFFYTRSPESERREEQRAKGKPAAVVRLERENLKLLQQLDQTKAALATATAKPSN